MAEDHCLQAGQIEAHAGSSRWLPVRHRGDATVPGGRRVVRSQRISGTEGPMRHADNVQFHEFVSARMERWRRSAYLLCHDWHTADDVVSIMVGRLYDHWGRVREADNVDAYAQRILTRTWLNETRRPWRRELPHG